MLFTLAVSAVTTVAFVMAPLLFARRIDLMPALGAGGRTGASVAEGRARMLLLAAQLALTVVLLFGAGLFVKSFVALTHVPLGFDPVNALAIRSTLSGPRYAADDQIRRYASDLADRAAATPGVRDVAIASTSPLGSGPLIRFARADGPALSPSDAPGAIVRAVSPSYFRTLATRIVRGREFLATDVAGAPRVTIVNQQLADQVFPGEDAVGKTINLLPARANWINRPGPVLIVGVASRIKEVGINEIDFPDVYLPFAQMPTPAFELVARRTCRRRLFSTRCVNARRRSIRRYRSRAPRRSRHVWRMRSRATGSIWCSQARSRLWRCCSRRSVSLAPSPTRSRRGRVSSASVWPLAHGRPN